MRPKAPWIWQQPGWPALTYSATAVAEALAQAYRMHGVMEGKVAAIGLAGSGDVALAALTDEVVATAAIEGERLPMEIVRSSVMRRLGIPSPRATDPATSTPSRNATTRSVDGLVAVVADATTAHDQPLDEDRLFRWQSALFPGGTSGIRRIAVGRYRAHADAMQIVSGQPGREVVHFEGPPSKDVHRHMQEFLRWFAASAPSAASDDRAARVDGLARAAIAHLWFESIHPFEDGNGRIGRAIVDMALAQHLDTPVRLSSLSRQLLASGAGYYDHLNRSQRGGMDVTDWVRWFASQCAAAYRTTSAVIDQALDKRRFWERHEATRPNDRQRKVLQRLLDDGDGGFAGGLNAGKYMKMTGASKATATRDLSEMVRHTQLWTNGTGKALRYHVAVPGWSHGVQTHRPKKDDQATGDRSLPKTPRSG